jgi:hypothetical protein
MKECPTCSLCYEDAAKFCSEDGQELIPSLAGPRELGRWRLDRVVGVGRQGSVYSATDLNEDRRVIVKTLLPSLFLEQGAVGTFVADMDRLAHFSHPNAGAVYAVGRLANGGAFVACEYISGRSLKRALSEDGQFTVDRAVEIACQLGEVLGAAHQEGIIHRDVKAGQHHSRSGTVRRAGEARRLWACAMDQRARRLRHDDHRLAGDPNASLLLARAVQG